MPKNQDWRLDWATPGKPDLKAPDRYTADTINDLPVFFLQRQDVWRKADTAARAEMRDRTIEMLASSMDGKDEQNLKELTRRYPNMTPGVMQGLAQGTPWVMPNGKTAEPYSDQGTPIMQEFDQAYKADVSSNVANGTYGATVANPAPQALGLGAITITGSTAPAGATDFSGETNPRAADFEQSSDTINAGDIPEAVVNVARGVKGAFNVLMNVGNAIKEIPDAAGEVSAGNEAKAAELARRANMTADQARQVFGERGKQDDNSGQSNLLTAFQTDIDPETLVAGIDENSDQTIPKGDIDVAEAQRQWTKHLEETGQINPENGERSFRSITGRMTLTQQGNTDTVGQGGWFGGGLDEEVDKPLVALAKRQSNQRTFADRQDRQRKADVIRREYEDAGQQLSLDDYTLMQDPRTYTEGRGITHALGMTPGSLAEMTLSGAIDFVFTLGTDPTTYTPAGLVKGAATKSGFVASHLLPSVRAGERAPWFEIDEMMRKAKKGKDLQVTEDIYGASGRPNTERIDNYMWDKSNGDWILRDEQGVAPEGTARLKRAEKFDEYYGGWRINHTVKSGTKGTRRYVVTKDGGNAQTFTTLKEARAHVETPENFGNRSVRTKDQDGKIIEPGGRKTTEKWSNGLDEPGDLTTMQTKERERYLMAQGIPQSRVTSSQAAHGWLRQSVTGNAFASAVAKNDSESDIWMRMGRKVPMAVAARLKNAKTVEEVWAVMDSAVGTLVTDPTSLQRFNGIRSNAFDLRMSMAEKPYLNRVFRSLSFAPKAVPINMGDKDDVMEAAYRFGLSVHMTPREMRPYLDRLAESDSNLKTFNTFHDEFVMIGVKDSLRRAGVPDDRINKVLEKVRNTRKGKSLKKAQGLRKEDSRKAAITTVEELMAQQERVAGGQMMDTSIADNTFVKGLDDEVALFANDLSASHLVLPTARELRRETNKIGQVLRKADPTDMELVDMAMNTFSASLDTWRNLTLMNISYISRNIAEEIMTMGLMGKRGFLTNPFHAIATAWGIQASLQYAQGARSLRKVTNALSPNLRAIREMKYRPENYTGVRLVDKDALRPLLTRLQADEATVAMTGKRGRAPTAKGSMVGMEQFTRDVARGIVKPIEVTVDYKTGMYGVTDGVKRLLAAFDADEIGQVPIRIKPGPVDPDKARAVPFSKRDDYTHADLFGSAARGTLEDMQGRMRQAVRNQLGANRALKAIMPYFDHNLALANGESMGAGLDDAVRTGDQRDIPKFMQFTTRLYGSALAEEHPDKVASGRRIYNSSGQATSILFPREKDGTPIPPTVEEHIEYVKHYADMLSELTADKVTRQYLAGDKTIDQLTMEIVNDPKALRDVLGALKQGLHDTAANHARRGSRQVDRLSDDDVIRYHEENAYDTVRGVLQENLRSVEKYLGDGTSPVFRQAVIDGRFDGKVLNSRNRKLKAAISDELEGNSSFRNAVPGLRTADLVEPKVWSRITTGFFSTAGNMRDMMTLHPFMRDEYVNEIARLVPYMSEQGRAKLVSNLRLANDKKFVRRINEIPVNPTKGWLDPETAHKIADVYTRKAAEAAFYDAANRRNWALALRWASPFAQAAVNSTYRWGTAMARDPIAAHRTARSLNAMNDAMGEWVGVYEPELEDQMGAKGYLDSNQYGEDVFIYPLVGKLAGLLGFDKAAAAFTSSSVNIFQTGVVTGFGPAVMFAIGSSPFRNVQTRNDVIGDVFRFFQPYPMDTSGIGEGYSRAGAAFIPAKWKGVFNVDDEQVTRLSQALLTARLSRNEYGPMEEWSPSTAKLIGEDLNNDARRLLKLEAITKIAGPLLGSFSFSPMINTDKAAEAMPEGLKGKAVLDHMITAEYQAYVASSTGDERMKRQGLFMLDYGKYLGVVAQSRTDEGVDRSPVYTNTGNATNFAYAEPELYKRYRNSIGFMFVGGDYERQWTDYDRFLREQDKATGTLKVRDPINQVEYTRQYMMRWAKADRERQAVSENSDNLEDVLRGINKTFEELNIAPYDPTYRQYMMGQIREAANDPKVLNKVKSATMINQYFKAKDRVVGYIQKKSDLAGDFSGDTVWTQDNAVRQLYMAGVKAAAEDEGFANFWSSLAEGEYGDMPQKYLGVGD